jgi:hypothetical protein
MAKKPRRTGLRVVENVQRRGESAATQRQARYIL